MPLSEIQSLTMHNRCEQNPAVLTLFYDHPYTLRYFRGKFTQGSPIMAIYEVPSDKQVDVGRLFALARKLRAKGGGASGRDAILEDATNAGADASVLTALSGLLAYPVALEKFLVSFLNDKNGRRDKLSEAGVRRATGPEEGENVALGEDDADILTVVLDSPTHFHISLPDDFMDPADFDDPDWLGDLGRYIMRKCK